MCLPVGGPQTVPACLFQDVWNSTTTFLSLFQSYLQLTRSFNFLRFARTVRITGLRYDLVLSSVSPSLLFDVLEFCLDENSYFCLLSLA
ncbi:unnamed protein product [Arabis nemorensis]|uniref:Uncharacterized protein n=1 Tax=Arabis nemorensis TaxID=586526 RepID=A0A565AV09_9BRAS|nr:unnamed protein product [Arabis nemorensis]